MYVSEVFNTLRRRWYATLLVVVLAVAAALGLSQVMAKAPEGTATVQILVDSPVSSLVNLQSNPVGLEARGAVLAQAMASNAVLASIARFAGISTSNLTAQGPYSGAGEVLDVPTPSAARGMQIVSSAPQYRLTVVAQQAIPIVTASVQGPSPQAAGRVADAVLPGTNAWLRSLETGGQIASGRLVRLRQLGDAQAGSINTRSAKTVAAVGAAAVLILGLLGLVLADRERKERRYLEHTRGARSLDLACAAVADSPLSPADHRPTAPPGAPTMTASATDGGPVASFAAAHASANGADPSRSL